MVSFQKQTHFSTDLLTLWQKIIAPCASYLADECGLSIIATQRATPIILQAIYYQTLKIAHTPTTFEKLLMPFTKKFSIPLGINFKQIDTLRPSVTQFFPNFFSDTASFWATIGITSQRTNAHPQKLAHLAQWLSFLAWQSLAQIQQRINIDTTQLIELLVPIDSTTIDRLLLDSILLDKAITIPDLFYSNSKQISISSLWSTHRSLLQSYQDSQPFALLPRHSFSAEKIRLVSPNHSSHSLPLTQIKTTEISSKTAIFTKNPDSNHPLHKTLQKHWIAFTVGLSALVIGGIGAISTNNKPATDNSPIATTKPADIPHDVAIVRTSAISSPASTASPSKKLVAHPPTNQSKTADKQDTYKKIPITNQTKDKTKKTLQSTTKKNTVHDATHTVKTSKPVSSSPNKPLKKSADDD